MSEYGNSTGRVREAPAAESSHRLRIHGRVSVSYLQGNETKLGKIGVIGHG